jgi:hypothetical protein
MVVPGTPPVCLRFNFELANPKTAIIIVRNGCVGTAAD